MSSDTTDAEVVGTGSTEVLDELRRIREANEARTATAAVEGTVHVQVDGFADLDTFFDDHLRLPVRGKVYSIPPASADLGLLCTKMLQAGEQASQGKIDTTLVTELNDADEQDLYQLLLGHYPESDPRHNPDDDVWQQLLDDGVDWQRLQHVGTTAMIWTALGRAAATDFWRSGARPKAPEPSTPRTPQDRKPPTKAVAKRTPAKRAPAKGSAKSAPRASRAGTKSTSASSSRRSPGKTS